MLLDIMSSYRELPVNIKAIQIFGIPCATYWAELLNIYPRVIQKKMDDLQQSGGYFTVDREYVQSRLCLSAEEQIAFDLALNRVGVLRIDPDDSNKISINLDAMFEILAEDDAKVLKKIRDKAKTKKTDETAAKRLGKIATFTGFTATLSHTPEVQEAYKLWVEAIIEGKKGNLTKGVIQIFHDTLCEFTQDPATQVRIIREAAAAGYTNVSWVLPKNKPSYSYASGTRINAPQAPKTNVGVDLNSGF